MRAIAATTQTAITKMCCSIRSSRAGVRAIGRVTIGAAYGRGGADARAATQQKVQKPTSA